MSTPISIPVNTDPNAPKNPYTQTGKPGGLPYSLNTPLPPLTDPVPYPQDPYNPGSLPRVGAPNTKPAVPGKRSSAAPGTQTSSAPPTPPPGTPYTGPIDDSKYGGSQAQRDFVNQVRAASQGKNEDFDRFSAAQIAAWQPFYDAEASQKAGKPQFRSQRGAAGFFDKPTECPEGQVPKGAGESAPCVPASSLQGGGRGGAGGGAGGAAGGEGGAGGWGISDEEKAYLTSMGGLADTMKAQSEKLFGVGMKDYQRSSDYYTKLMGAFGRGGIESALGPTREMTSETFAGERAKLRGLRGAERAAAEAQLTAAEAGTLARQPAELQAQAAAGLGKSAEFGISSGIATEGQAAGVYGNMLQAAMQSRLTEEGFDTQKWITQLQTKTQWNIAALQDATDREAIAAQKEMGYATLSQSAYQWSYDYNQRSSALVMEMERFNSQQDTEQRGQSLSFFGNVIAAVFGGAGRG